MFKTNKTSDQIFNRILINFGIGALAYVLLYILYSKLYMQNIITFSLIVIFLVASALFYGIKQIGKTSLKNYAHMFLAFALALLFTRLSVVVGWIVGMNTFMAMVNKAYWIKMLFNTQKEVMAVSIAGGIYLVLMLFYNCILLAVAPKNRKR